MSEIEALRILPGHGIEILDQTLLPAREEWLTLTTVAEVCEAIRVLRVRGAPLLGLVGVCGMAIAAGERGTDDITLARAAKELAATRPTAIDLHAGVDAAMRAVRATSPDDAEARTAALWAFAQTFAEQRKREDLAMAEHGAALLPEGGAVLTHCNTGTLATAGSGTALGIIRKAWELGRVTHVFVTETRPLLQGARLTAWELQKLGIPASLLPDTAAASLIAGERVEAVITGADRIAANGDTANKVGTLGLALAAARCGIPFHIAAPRTTIDLACPNGSAIPIEFRDAAEVGGFGGQRWAPDGLDAYNPAFDVTPHDLIAAIVTEAGVAWPPFNVTLQALVRQP